MKSFRILVILAGIMGADGVILAAVATTLLIGPVGQPERRILPMTLLSQGRAGFRPPGRRSRP